MQEEEEQQENNSPSSFFNAAAYISPKQTVIPPQTISLAHNLNLREAAPPVQQPNEFEIPDFPSALAPTFIPQFNPNSNLMDFSYDPTYGLPNQTDDNGYSALKVHGNKEPIIDYEEPISKRNDDDEKEEESIPYEEEEGASSLQEEKNLAIIDKPFPENQTANYEVEMTREPSFCVDQAEPIADADLNHCSPQTTAVDESSLDASINNNSVSTEMEQVQNQTKRKPEEENTLPPSKRTAIIPLPAPSQTIDSNPSTLDPEATVVIERKNLPKLSKVDNDKDFHEPDYIGFERIFIYSNGIPYPKPRFKIFATIQERQDYISFLSDCFQANFSIRSNYGRAHFHFHYCTNEGNLGRFEKYSKHLNSVKSVLEHLDLSKFKFKTVPFPKKTSLKTYLSIIDFMNRTSVFCWLENFFHPIIIYLEAVFIDMQNLLLTVFAVADFFYYQRPKTDSRSEEREPFTFVEIGIILAYASLLFIHHSHDDPIKRSLGIASCFFDIDNPKKQKSYMTALDSNLVLHLVLKMESLNSYFQSSSYGFISERISELVEPFGNSFLEEASLTKYNFCKTCDLVQIFYNFEKDLNPSYTTGLFYSSYKDILALKLDTRSKNFTQYPKLIDPFKLFDNQPFPIYIHFLKFMNLMLKHWARETFNESTSINSLISVLKYVEKVNIFQSSIPSSSEYYSNSSDTLKLISYWLKFRVIRTSKLTSEEQILSLKKERDPLVESLSFRDFPCYYTNGETNNDNMLVIVDWLAFSVVNYCSYLQSYLVFQKSPTSFKLNRDF